MELFSVSYPGLPGLRIALVSRRNKQTEVIRLDGMELTRQLQKNSAGAQKFHVAVLKLLAGRLARMNEQVLELQVNFDDQKTGEIERLRERILREWSF